MSPPSALRGAAVHFHSFQAQGACFVSHVEFVQPPGCVGGPCLRLESHREGWSVAHRSLEFLNTVLLSAWGSGHLGSQSLPEDEPYIARVTNTLGPSFSWNRWPQPSPTLPSHKAHTRQRAAAGPGQEDRAAVGLVPQFPPLTRCDFFLKQKN